MGRGRPRAAGLPGAAAGEAQVLAADAARPILVTGGAGFIGSSLVRYLSTQPGIERLVNLDCLTYAGRPENLTDVAADPRYAFERVDLPARDAAREVLRGHAIT